MGNTIGKIGICFTGAGDSALDPSDEGLGHSFCYAPPDPTRIPTHHSRSSSIFRSISGASVSANTSTPPLSSAAATSSSGPIFQSSTYFASAPLHLQTPPRPFMSGPLDRAGFLSGPIDRPIFSGPLDRSFSHPPKGSLVRGLRRALSKTLRQSSVVAPVKWVLRHDSWAFSGKNSAAADNIPVDESESWESQNLLVQWAQGKAGEDRVHVVVSDEHGWVFVGIYDGFNGPDATDFLLSNLYSFVHKELKGLLWDDSSSNTCSSTTTLNSAESRTSSFSEVEAASISRYCQEPENYSKKSKNYRGVCNKREENQRRWKCEWDRERLELDRRLKEHWNRSSDCSRSINHSDVLKALSEALRKTEEAYFGVADKMVDENPELALMGSCVVAMLMKGEDVYVMNVGDSRAVLAQNKEPHIRHDQDLEMINEECLYDFRVSNDGGVKATLNACQLTMDHSTCVEEEVLRIKEEHPDDNCAIVNDRVKGSLKVTRAFGAGFLKQAKWNDAVLEMFRIEYIGTSSYLNCLPSLYHHKLCPKDQFLILSSDGLYQYFTNDEAVTEVEFFITLNPEGDPAQHLIEQLLFRAAKKAGMDLYELLEIPQGDRRKYHDDVSIIIISFLGRIWRSCL